LPWVTEAMRRKKALIPVPVKSCYVPTSGQVRLKVGSGSATML